MSFHCLAPRHDILKQNSVGNTIKTDEINQNLQEGQKGTGKGNGKGEGKGKEKGKVERFVSESFYIIWRMTSSHGGHVMRIMSRQRKNYYFIVTSGSRDNHQILYGAIDGMLKAAELGFKYRVKKFTVGYIYCGSTPVIMMPDFGIPLLAAPKHVIKDENCALEIDNRVNVALQELHGKLIHPDPGPHNLLIDLSNNNAITLTDWITGEFKPYNYDNMKLRDPALMNFIYGDSYNYQESKTYQTLTVEYDASDFD